jgi:hypothetical protein
LLNAFQQRLFDLGRQPLPPQGTFQLPLIFFFSSINSTE